MRKEQRVAQTMTCSDRASVARSILYSLMQVGGGRAAAHHFLAKEDGTKGGRKVHFWAEKKEREEISIGLMPSFRRPNRGRCFFPPGGVEAESDKDVVVVA